MVRRRGIWWRIAGSSFTLSAMARKISEGRKGLFYVGGAISLVGLIMFLSTFVSFATNFGNLDNFEGIAKSMMVRAFGGMILMIVGSAIRSMGRAGLAGSGVVLDPERAREELEPHARMTGGLVKDALDEAGVDLSRIGGGGGSSAAVEKVIMIRCRECRQLNEEDSKFCQECGRPI
jgi:hypothetical protein